MRIAKSSELLRIHLNISETQQEFKIKIETGLSADIKKPFS